MKWVFEVMLDTEKKFNWQEKYKVDRYLTAMGLSVKKNYFGQGLGKHLLLARETICRRVLDVSLTLTVFTAKNAQVLNFNLE